MKILLVGVNAKYIHSSPSLYYLKQYVKMKHPDPNSVEQQIEIAEYTINQEKDEIIRSIYQKQPDVIAFSCYLWNITYIHAILRSLAKVCPSLEIWLGGPEVSFDPKEQLLKYPMVRGIMVGEGEQSFYRMFQAYQSGMEQGKSANEAGAVLPSIMQADEGLCFDDVPFPYEDLSLFENRIVYYETSRGCPFGCTYCLSSVDTKVRLRSIELVKEELQRFLDANVPLVKFVDRTFNCNQEHTLAILQYIQEHDNGVTCFHFEMAAELITEEELMVLERLRPAQVQIEIGIQTTNCETLLAIRRRANFTQLSNVVRRLIAYRNMHIHVDLIAGLPYENLSSFKQSFNDVYHLHADELQLGFLKVLKGSPIEQQALEFAIQYQDDPPYEVLSTKWLSYQDIIELKGVEDMLETYYNSMQFVNTMRYLEEHGGYGSNAYELYCDLYHYYEHMGYLGRSHNRYARYQILREYAIARSKILASDQTIQIEEFTELLLHDLYLRDNVKSRPSYAIDTQVDKDVYRDFFASGRYQEYLPDYQQFSSAQVAKMVHIEKTKKGYVLYDYRNRNPLNQNARTVYMNKM